MKGDFEILMSSAVKPTNPNKVGREGMSFYFYYYYLLFIYFFLIIIIKIFIHRVK